MVEAVLGHHQIIASTHLGDVDSSEPFYKMCLSSTSVSTPSLRLLLARWGWLKKGSGALVGCSQRAVHEVLAGFLSVAHQTPVLEVIYVLFVCFCVS